MCITCGCDDNIKEQHIHDYEHNQQQHTHEHDRQSKEVNFEAAILAENSKFAKFNREIFNNKKTLSVNLLSSPGSGKTTLLEKTIKKLDNPLYVIEGDQHTELDSQRILNAGAQAYQINTGKTCHLDGHMVSHALEHLDITAGGFIFIENVGNLICPALFDLGEHVKIVIISVTEGEDKPLKYPDMFYAADLVIINKIDLLPYLTFDINRCISNIQQINSRARIIQLSAFTEDGMDKWIEWLHLAHAYYIV